MRPPFKRPTSLNPRRTGVISRLTYINFSLWAPLLMLILFLALPQGGVVKRASDKFQKAFAPIAAAAATPIQNGRQFINHLEQWMFAIEQNRSLRGERAALAAENRKFQQLLAENRRLVALVNLTAPEWVFQTAALVTADTSGTFARSILISVGSDDGIQKWDIVSAVDGILGKVVSTSAKSSRVVLLTDINSGIPVMSADGEFRAIMRGNNSPFPMLDFIEPQDAAMTEGTKLLTSGHGGHFAPGMTVGNLMPEQRVKTAAMVESWVSVMRYKRK